MGVDVSVFLKSGVGKLSYFQIEASQNETKRVKPNIEGGVRKEIKYDLGNNSRRKLMGKA